MTKRKSKEDIFWARVWLEHKKLGLPPWTVITPLRTMGEPCPAYELSRKAEWDKASAEFHEILRRDPHHYDDCL